MGVLTLNELNGLGEGPSWWERAKAKYSSWGGYVPGTEHQETLSALQRKLTAEGLARGKRAAAGRARSQAEVAARIRAEDAVERRRMYEVLRRRKDAARARLRSKLLARERAAQSAFIAQDRAREAARTVSRRRAAPPAWTPTRGLVRGVGPTPTAAQVAYGIHW